MPKVIDTVSAHCQDCNRCVRVCPIDAIRVKGGQARVDGALCVQCGTCVRECPQHAKVIHNGLPAVKAMIEQGDSVAVSLDPAFVAVYDGWRTLRLPAALRRLGFSTVSEAAEGAKAVVREANEARQSASILSACPAVVMFIEKYRPHLLPLLMPVVSPMIAHGRMLKARLGAHTKVVYIGPCAAKKGEAQQKMYADAIDAVLTFDELNAWLQEEGIELQTCLESGFETFGEPGDARLFPLEGGFLKTAGIQTDAGMPNILHISGAREVIALFDTPTAEWTYDIVEPWFCRGGCIGGPCMPPDIDLFTATRRVIAYRNQVMDFPGDSPEVKMDVTFKAINIDSLLPEISEAQIEEILESTGKGDEESRINCGACGYNSCRENAIAVARGLAEPGMCSSYTRKKAEKRADRIIETSPNGIVVVNMDLNIVHMNARFHRMFGCSNSLLGRPVSHIVDSEGFEKLINGATGLQEGIHTRDSMKYQELIYTLPGQDELIGIYVDVSATTFDSKQVDLIKDQSLRHARSLLEHQIRFSQEMAHYLGKSTAQTEELVKRLMDMYAEDTPQ